MKDRQRFTFPQAISDAITNIVLLGPAIVFWISTSLYAGLGTDYIFDLVIEKIGQRNWGNILLTSLVIGLPSVGIAFNGLAFMGRRAKIALWGWVLSGFLLILGFYAALRKA